MFLNVCSNTSSPKSNCQLHAICRDVRRRFQFTSPLNIGVFPTDCPGSRREPLTHHALTMQAIRLDTFRALLEHEYQVGCWCPGCRRWATTDLAMLVRNGLGDRSITACKARCRKCGMEGQWQVRPPCPNGPYDFPIAAMQSAAVSRE